MTPLGLSTDACRAALERYRVKARALAAAAADRPSRGTETAGAAEALLDEFLFDLEVDVAARSTPEGRSRMSSIEKTVFEPAVRELRGLAARIARTDAMQWLPALVGFEVTAGHWLQRLGAVAVG